MTGATLNIPNSNGFQYYNTGHGNSSMLIHGSVLSVGKFWVRGRNRGLARDSAIIRKIFVCDRCYILHIRSVHDNLSFLLSFRSTSSTLPLFLATISLKMPGILMLEFGLGRDDSFRPAGGKVMRLAV